jgi:hypothetical protein
MSQVPSYDPTMTVLGEPSAFPDMLLSATEKGCYWFVSLRLPIFGSVSKPLNIFQTFSFSWQFKSLLTLVSERFNNSRFFEAGQ